jgi:hypothetical protein
LHWKFWLAKLFGFFVLDCSDCQIFDKDHICQMYNIVLFRLQCNLAKASIVNLSLPPQLSKDLRYLTNYEVCQIELALLTWLG